MTKKQKKVLYRIIIAAVLLLAVILCEKLTGWSEWIFRILVLVP